MEWLSVRDAATRMGVTTVYVYKLRGTEVLRRNDAGEVSEEDVQRIQRVRHRQAVAKLGGEERMAQLAGGVHDRLHPRMPHAYPGTFGAAAIPLIDGDTVAALGYNNVEKAALPDTAGCRWCWSRIAYRVHGGVDAYDGPIYRALFASEPCRLDRERWAKRVDALAASGAASEARRQAHLRKQAGEAMAAEEARITAEQEQLKRDSDRLRREKTALQRRRSGLTASAGARSVTATRGGTAAARPVGDQNGADLVAAQRQKLMKQLMEASDRGDLARHSDIVGQMRRLGHE